MALFIFVSDKNKLKTTTMYYKFNYNDVFKLIKSRIY